MNDPAHSDASATAPKPSIGFIGIGLMGEPMVLRLIESGYRLIVWNREPEHLDTVVSHGALAAASPAALASEADFILLCVLDTGAVRDVVFGPDGIASAKINGKVLIDFSTIDPEASREMALRLQDEHGTGWVDAPVSGGPPAARQGKLTVMAGGREDHVQRAKPIIASLAARITHMGGPGAGQIAKIVNQAICGIGYVQMAEALCLAEAAGIEASRLPECLRGGHADSTMLQVHFPRMVARDFANPASYARQMLKDLRAVVAFAEKHGVQLPLAHLAMSRYEAYVAAGHGLAETASISNLYLPSTPQP